MQEPLAGGASTTSWDPLDPRNPIYGITPDPTRNTGTASPYEPPPPPKTTSSAGSPTTTSYTGAQEILRGNGSAGSTGTTSGTVTSTGAGALPPASVSIAQAAGTSTAKAITGPRRYNATLHPTSRPVLSGSGTRGAGPRPYTTGEIIAVYEQADLRTLSNSAGQRWYDRKTNWAFRFLYNPNAITVSTQIDAEATPTLLDPGLFFGQQQAIGFQLYLNRTAEVNWGIQNADYREIIAAGTQYDVNHLYKVINGDRGDVGFLVNTLVRVVFGPSIFYEGFITNIDVQHTHFNARMTPIQSMVNITMTRVNTFATPSNQAAS